MRNEGGIEDALLNSSSVLLRKRTDVIQSQVDEELLILDMQTNQIHQLNPTASYLWNEFDGEKSPGELAIAFADHFGIDIETAKNDVQQVISLFQSLNLLVETKPSSQESL
jgi:Coenzyme PQQ synthesis protein D (PqqD)